MCLCVIFPGLFIPFTGFKVARKLSDLIELLVVNGMKLEDLLMVGHSLGAHVAGCAAKLLTSGRPSIIIGLDPARVDFDFFETSKRLTYMDADYVQIIHTDGDKFGFSDPMGNGKAYILIGCYEGKDHFQRKIFVISADFYPNRGKDQPGCPARNAITNLLGNYEAFITITVLASPSN